MKPQVLLTMALIAFVAALLFTFVSAVLPAEHAPHFVPWDKAAHFLAFYALTVLATAAFPRSHLLGIAIVLSLFGAFIEFVQGLSFVARDRDFKDWVADSIAIGAAMGPMVLVGWRRWVGGTGFDGGE